MVTLNLSAEGAEQELIKNYLQENASEVLANKINNGVRIEKDGKTLINKKDLKGFLSFACEEARKQAEKSARSACVQDSVVFGWAIHYFEEDGFEGTLYNEDGTEYIAPKPVKTANKTSKVSAPVKKQEAPQMTLFDFMESYNKDNEAEEVETEPVTEPQEAVSDDDDQPTDEELQEIFKELAEEEAKQKEAEQPKGSPLYRNYMDLQRKYPDTIIAQRLGDFYEVFGEGVKTVAEELDLTLTGRDCGLDERVPMVGFPYHAADAYIAKIAAKHKVAVVETIGDVKVIDNAPQTEIDEETGEILTESEMREFDGDIVEPVVPDNEPKSVAFEPNGKLPALFGNLIIVR